MDTIEKPAGTAVQGIKWRWPAIHPEGYKYIAVGAGAALLFFAVGWSLPAWLCVGLTVWIISFFRDPIRTVPGDPELIVAPADGLITLIQKVPPPPEMRGPGKLGDDPLTRVSIFMSVFDVHINRAPIAGTVADMVYVPGKFVNADLDKASEDNERNHVLMRDKEGRMVGFTQIAGLVARRILPFVKRGDIVAVGQRIGLIRFGSRVDVYLPAGTMPAVLLGQRSIAGETVIARLGEDRVIAGVAQ